MEMADISTMTTDTASLAALSRNRDKRALERAQAQQMGRSAQGTPEEIKKKTREVAEEFVSVFMNQVMKSMRATVQENPEFHGDNGEKFFQEMLDTEQSKSLAKGSGYGLTDLIYNQLMASSSIQSVYDIPQASASAAVMNPIEQPAAGMGAVPENDLKVSTL